MAGITFLFPGQGAQYAGMGKDLCEVSPAAADIFRRADAIRPGTSALCFEGSEEDLRRTENTQPCLFTVEMALAEALREKGLTADYTAGFSLGELSALCYSGRIGFDDCFSLVCRRAALMQEDAEKVETSMVAVVRLDNETVKALCREFDGVYPVNFNSPGQVSVAGKRQSMPDFTARVKETGGRAIPLKVSGGFHSPFMADAAASLGKELQGYTFKEATRRLYSNETGELYTADPRSAIASQICHPVLFERQVRTMAADGADLFLEVGPGTVLKGLVERILPGRLCLSAGTLSDFEVLQKEGLIAP